MDHLKQGGWVPVIKSWVNGGKPLMGICLGMQLLFEGSEEDAPGDGRLIAGMGILQGRVERFKPLGGERIKVPHMGWNCVRWTRADEPLFASLESEVWAYFVHGYYVVPPEPPSGWGRGDSIVAGWSQYPMDRPFCAAIRRGKIWATQFHPEKSQRAGLQMLANFAGTTVPASA
jgi:glutamine amidotransferase